MTRLVAIESPYGGPERERNKRYLAACILDCVARGENPYASHGFFTQVLDDDDPAQRELGIKLGLEWAAKAAARVVYVDLGITPGMREGIARAFVLGQTIEHRSLPDWSKS